MQETYVNDLIAFIKANKDWRKKLLEKPYCLKNIVDVPYNNNWFMFNYNLFESLLSDRIVKACRGSILEVSDDRSVVRPVCFPFYKFFGYDDPNADIIDWTTAKTRLKVDGQLIKMFKYNGQNYWCTNGSPNVETPLDYTDDKIANYKELLESAILGRTLDKLIPSAQREAYSYVDKAGAWHMHQDNPDGNCPTSWISRIPDGWTLMFELTSPYNRIIVEYKDIQLWFHGARDADGIEYDPEDIAKKFDIPYKIPQQFDFKDFDQAFETIKNWHGFENEGIVVCDADFHRVKVKCDDYLKVKFVRDVSTPKGIFWIVISEQFDDLSSYRELQEMAEKQREELVTVINKLKDWHKGIVEKRKTFEDQKAFALWVMAEHKDDSKYYFSAAKMSEGDFIAKTKESLQSESMGYDRYLELKDFVERQ